MVNNLQIIVNFDFWLWSKFAQGLTLIEVYDNNGTYRII